MELFLLKSNIKYQVSALTLKINIASTKIISIIIGNICVQFSNVRLCSTNIRTQEHGFHRKFDDFTEKIKIRTAEHFKISEHSNIDHLDIRTLANKRIFERQHLKNGNFRPT